MGIDGKKLSRVRSARLSCLDDRETFIFTELSRRLSFGNVERCYEFRGIFHVHFLSVRSRPVHVLGGIKFDAEVKVD